MLQRLTLGLPPTGLSPTPTANLVFPVTNNGSSSPSASPLTVEEQIRELRELRQLLIEARRSTNGVNARLAKENRKLQAEKQALLRYIHELENIK